MAEIGHTEGQATFRAATDMKKFRLVRVKVGSVYVPPEVEYADDGTLLGVTDEEAAAGKLISIRPLNMEGTYEYEVVVDTAINSGTPLFVADDGTGRATDKDTGYYVGQALRSAVTGQVIEVGGILGATSSGQASNISVVDSGGYYQAPKNVENCLAQLGAYVTATQVEANQSVIYSRRMNSDFTPMDNSELGGLITSGTYPISFVTSSEGVLVIRVDPDPWTDKAYLTIQGGIPPGYKPGFGAFNLGAYYRSTTGQTGAGFQVNFGYNVLYDDGTVDQNVNYGVNFQDHGGDFSDINASAVDISAGAIGLSFDLTFTKTTSDPGHLDLYSLYYRYDLPLS
jgi:hypothetical protein